MNKQVIQDSKPFISLPIKQTIGCFDVYNPNAPCCVGARLAQFMKVENGYYLTGADDFARALGGNRAHLILLLKQAGAGNTPFSHMPWKTDPVEVWENLLKIERLPDLTNANLKGAYLSRANLTNANLTNANLTNAILIDAILTNANLTNANLTNANLTDANLTDANLTDANLTNANLTNANLTNTNTTNIKGVFYQSKL